MQQLEIRQSREIKRCSLFELHRVTTVTGEQLLFKSFAFDDASGDLLEREQAMFARVPSPRLARPMGLAYIREQLGACYADFPGASPPSPPLRDFDIVARFARELCDVLDDFHEAGLLILGLSPRSFLLDDAGHVQLVDAPFAQPGGGASAPSEADWIRSPFLPYAAPEAVRPLARGLERGADLYALGAVLYELLSGRPPFEALDPAELIQSHLARQPAPLAQLVTELPASLTSAIMQLLAKQPADRPASTHEFLRACRLPAGEPGRVSLLVDGARPTASWSPRSYGRESTRLDLRSSLEESTQCIVTFVQGEPGSGKTTLLEELRQAPFVSMSAWGRFERAGASQPLSGWSALARSLARAALSAGPKEFGELNKRFEEVLGGSGPALVSLAREWDAVLRCGPGPAEHVEGGLNRTAVGLQRLLSCYADAATPMWVFLDDVQWADPSSLRIWELILTLPHAPNLRVIASLRSPEPGEDRSALTSLIEALERGGIETATVELQGLGVTDLRAFVHDSLGPHVDGVDDLVRFLLDKTHGNPFFVRELLDALVREGALTREAAGWRYAGSTPSVALPGSLLDLLRRRVHRLPEETKALLVAAACIGEGVRRSDLCLATQLDPKMVNERLEAVVAQGLMNQHRNPADSSDPGYVFAHDRILEAALALATEAERAALSMKLFRLLSEEGEASGRLLTFTLANLFNAGSSNVENDAQRLAGVLVNQAAGEVAKSKGAYSQALHHLSNAVEQLRQLRDDACWSVQAELTRVIFAQAAEAALLCNRFELTRELGDEVLAHSVGPLQRGPGYEYMIRALAAQKRFGEAVELALRAQAELGVHFPRNPKMAHVIWGYIWTLRRVKALGPQRLLRLPARREEESTVASRLMQAVFAITHFHKPELFPLFVYWRVEQCVTRGNDAYASQAYSAMSMILAGLGQVELAHELGEVALTLPSTPASEKLRCRSLFTVASFVEPWLRPARETFSQLEQVAQAALEHGDFEFFGYAVTMRGLGLLYAGSGLLELGSEFEENLTQLRSLGNERNVLMQSLMCEAVHELRNGAADGPLSGPYYERTAGLSRGQDPMDHTLVFHHHLAALLISAHLGDLPAARSAVQRVQPHVANGAFGSYLLAPFLFYEAWLIGVDAGTEGQRAASARRRLRKSLKQLRAWCKKAPANFLAKTLFVEAELLRLAGRFEEAARKYEAAIDEARAQSSFQEAALAHRRAASLWLARGFARLAGQHLRDAQSLYRHWGALAAANRLSEEHPRHVSLFPPRLAAASDATRPAQDLDYRALIKASQAISSEVQQPRLLERLLQTVMEHTAAQRGVLLIEQRGNLVVAASAELDQPRVRLVADETIDNTERVSRAIVRYVARIEEAVVLGDATRDATFGRDPYVQAVQPRSVLCTPISYQGKLLGLIYLENNLVDHVFDRGRLEMVSLLAGQAGISIANARFHALQLEAQQAKISPHFLFNALSSIAELAIVEGAKAETAIVKLSHLYRYILASSETELVSLEQELSIVRDYLSLEKLRFGSKLDFSVTHEGPLEQVHIPGLLIQPLVENSIRHAIAPKLGNGRVWVQAKVGDGRCSIVVQDDGDGTKHVSSGMGFGLRSVQQRLELVYGNRFSFAISQRGGYRVELEVPSELGAVN